MDEKAYDPLTFMSRKILRYVVAASIGDIVAWQHYNSERQKQETEAGLKESTVWVTEYLCVYREPSVGLTLRSPPPPGSFSTVTCAMGKLKPQQISQIGIFTSVLYNPITPTALKPLCACVCVSCVTGLNLLQTANQYSLLLSISTQQWRRQPANQHEAEQWLDMLLSYFSSKLHKDYWIFTE